MGWILTLGIVIVLFLQSLGSWLVEPMRLLSQLGTETFYMVFMPVLVWCVDYAWGLRMGVALMVSASLNHAMKLVFLGPRPYWVDERVIPLSVESSLGAPSGHAQNAVAVWGMMAAWVGTRLAWGLAMLLAFLIGLSRLYLGMHFPHDVLMGWLAGGLVLWGLLKAEKLIQPWLKRSSTGAVILAAFAASLALILLSAGMLWAARDWSVPQTWLTLSARAEMDGDEAGMDPLSPTGVVSTAAAFFGLAAGAALLHRRGGYDPHGSTLQMAARYLLGISGLLILFIGLDMVFPDGIDVGALAFRYLRYALVGAWTTFLAPEIFMRINLAKRPAAPHDAALTGQTI